MKEKTTEQRNKEALARLLKDRSLGVRIDVGCGANPIPGFIGMDIRDVPGVDIIVDLEKFPWPVPNEVASTVACSHVLEHIVPQKVDARVVCLIDLLKKKKILTDAEIKTAIGDYKFESTFIRFMDEVWRILKPGGEFLIRVPYAGTIGYYQDPTHVNMLTEATFMYFDPFHPSNLFKIYRPKPWEIKHCFYDTEAIMEILLIKRREDKSFMKHVQMTGKGLSS